MIQSTHYLSQTMDPNIFNLYYSTVLWHLTFLILFCIIQIICEIAYGLFGIRPRRIKFEHINKEKEFDSIKKAVEYVLKQENIRSRQDLDAWSNGRCRQKFYAMVKKLCKVTWNMENDPIAVARRAYESLLPGYANSSISTF